MVEIECPLCTESIDLGMAEEGEYECPYCEYEFYWESDNSVFNLDDYWENFDLMDAGLWLFFIFFFVMSSIIIIFGEPCSNCGDGP
jgi:hypothetical protein